ncbi:hypothetical protein [Thiocystis violascens]|uniref:Uncharacterized protein n=1 Tax=Thiocystis violascens (strain ATCC 17096 / DSM 198 / 6111) TaxID=765911 RepID=I3YGR0_THIV6|nr:hypothetical protein [Thiocystis violascens]AFL76178.1 hypothetical protein Thivi_4373 [Thiocystis violascens DSM 198]
MNFPDWAPPSVIERWQECMQENEEELARSIAFYRDLQEKGELSKDYDAETIAREDRKDALDFPGMIGRLLTDEKMEWAWKRLPKLKERNQRHHSALIEAIFIRVVERGFYGSVTRIERMPTAEFLKWIADVQATAAKLAGLVEDTGLDYYLWRDFKKAQVQAAVRCSGLQTSAARPANIAIFDPN